jgi:ABC-2 type transport system permease protein
MRFMATRTPQRQRGSAKVTPITREVIRPGPRSAAAVWWRIYLHHLRLLRNSAIAWIVGLAGITWGVAATFELRHGSEEELAALGDMEGIPAFEALVGRYVEPATVEGLTLSRWGMFGILAAVWGMLAGAKLLRGAEEAGHVEPLRAGVISPRAFLASALAALFTTHLVFMVAIGLGHTAGGMDAATSWATGGAIALLTASSATGAALTSQLAPTRRRAVGMVGIALGAALGLRVLAAATVTPDWVWWTTPFGWIGFLHETDGARHWIFLAFGLLLAVLLVATFTCAGRDLHAARIGVGDEGVVRRQRRPVGGQVGLAIRLTAPPARTWGLIVALFALVFGLVARDFAEAAAALPATVEVVEQMGIIGLDTPAGIIAWTLSMFVGLLVSVFVAGQVAAIREEEATWRIEHLLARPLGRLRWLVTRVLTVAVAAVAIAVTGGIVAWFATVLVDVPITFGDGLLAGLNVVPVALLVLGIGIGLFGLLPRVAVPLTYGLVVGAFALDFVGGLLELPTWVLDLSPFRHLASVPAVDMDLGAALVMLLVGVVAAAIGMMAFRRRDLQEA